MPKIKAFSLIEMMFVIIVIAVIAVYAVNMLNKRAQTALATRTAAQMQEWYQAVQNYYRTNRAWPVSWNDISGVSGNGQFLPDSARCSEILNNGSSSNCNDYGYFHLYLPEGNDPEGNPYTATTAPFINLETQVPNAVLGKQIVSMLPNSSYTNCSTGSNPYVSSASGECVNMSIVAVGALLFRQQKMAAAVSCNNTHACTSTISGYCFATNLSITNIGSHNTSDSFVTYCNCPQGGENCNTTSSTPG